MRQNQTELECLPWSGDEPSLLSLWIWLQTLQGGGVLPDGEVQLTRSMCSHHSSCPASILDGETRGKGVLLHFWLDGMQRWNKITSDCALFCVCWLVVFYTAWSIPGTYFGGVRMLKYKCRCGFYEQWTKVRKLSDQNKTLFASI